MMHSGGIKKYDLDSMKGKTEKEHHNEINIHKQKQQLDNQQANKWTTMKKKKRASAFKSPFIGILMEFARAINKSSMP